MTIPELLIGVVLTGMIMSALSAAVIVVLRQSDNTDGRLNNARSETGIGLWMPADLASAAVIPLPLPARLVDTDPLGSPCFDVCPAGLTLLGSNALLVQWTTQVSDDTKAVLQTTRVSYRYALVGEEYQMIRVECTLIAGGVQTCRSLVVLHDLDGPPSGSFLPGDAIPTGIIAVKDPYKPDATSDTATDPGLTSKNSSRVVVTVNGGGDAAGAGGGTNQISISAGGTNRKIIDGSSMDGAPSLIAARSRCGGRIALVIDESTSIGSTALGNVKTAVKSFVNSFAGTPVKLELVNFSTTSGVLGTGAAHPWSRYFDMLDESDVISLTGVPAVGAVPAVPGLIDSLKSSGYTNWEDALQRTFFQSNGDPQDVLPALVVFFTDGVPTISRLTATSAPPTAPSSDHINGYPLYDSRTGDYLHEGFVRADAVASQFRDGIRFIGVGVGPDIHKSQAWVTILGYHYDYQRAYHWNTYNRWYHIEKSFHYEKGSNSTYQRGYHIQTKSGSAPFANVSTDAASLNSTTRVRFTEPYNYFRTVTMSSSAIPDKATNWASTGGSTNQQMYDSENDISLGDLGTDATDEWKQIRSYAQAPSYADWEDVSLAGYTAITTTGKRKTYEAPTGASDSLVIWETDTSLSAPGASARVSFTAPFQYPKSVVGSDKPYAEGALAWTFTSSGTNVALFKTQNVPATSITDHSYGWTTSGKAYGLPSDFWEATDKAGYDAASGSNKRTAVDSLPFDYLYSPKITLVDSAVVLSRLISGSDIGIPGVPNGAGDYTNAAVANMYVLPEWDKFEGALRAVALAECGGTLTLQTRLGTKAAGEPFTYQKSAVWDSSRAVVTTPKTVVTTTQTYSSGTFDLSIKNGTYVTVEIQPQKLSDISGYIGGTWACKAGVTSFTDEPLSDDPVFKTVDIPDSNWNAIRVRVYANQAVSCIQTVTR